MGRDLKIRTAVVAVAISVLVGAMVGIYIHLAWQSHNDDKQAECVRGITELVPDDEMNAAAIGNIVAQCERDPDAANEAWLSRYLKQVAETKTDR